MDKAMQDKISTLNFELGCSKAANRNLRIEIEALKKDNTDQAAKISDLLTRLLFWQGEAIEARKEQLANLPDVRCRCAITPYFGEYKCTDKDAEIAKLKAEVDSLSKSLRTEKSASEVQRVRLYTEIETLTSENAEMKRKLDTFRHFGMEAI